MGIMKEREKKSIAKVVVISTRRKGKIWQKLQGPVVELKETKRYMQVLLENFS